MKHISKVGVVALALSALLAPTATAASRDLGAVTSAPGSAANSVTPYLPNDAAGADHIPVGGLFEGKQAFQYFDQQHFVSIRDGKFHHAWWGPTFGLKSDLFTNPDPADPFVGRPSAFAVGNQQHYFARTQSGLVRHYWWGPTIGMNNDVWGKDHASDPIASPYIGGESGGKLILEQILFTTKANGRMSEHYFNPTAPEKGVREYDWNDIVGFPQDLRGTVASGYTMTRDLKSFNLLHTFARTATGGIVHGVVSVVDENAPAFSDTWVPAGEAAGDPFFASYRGYDEHLFYVNKDGKLMHRFFVPGMRTPGVDEWQVSGLMNNFSKTSRATGFEWDGQEHVVAAGADGSIQHRFYDPNVKRILGDEIAKPNAGGVNDVTSLVMSGQQHVFWTSPEGIHHAFWGPGMPAFKNDKWPVS